MIRVSNPPRVYRTTMNENWMVAEKAAIQLILNKICFSFIKQSKKQMVLSLAA
jgi:hypothetical protein